MGATQFVIFVLGIVAGILATVGADLLKRHFYRPKLQILEDCPEEGQLFSCHSIKITNKGRSAAKNCHAMLTFQDLGSLDLIPENKVIKVKDLGIDPRKFALDQEETYLLKEGDFRAIENEFVCWSSVGNPLTIDVFPRTFRMFDVCRFIKSDVGQIQIPSENGWKSMRAAVRNRHYSIEVKVVAKNARTAEASFVIEPLEKGIVFKKKVKKVRLMPAIQRTKRANFNALR